MTSTPLLVPSPRKPSRPYAFHPVRALFGVCIGLLIGLVLCAATGHWAWLLLAPAGGLLLLFDGSLNDPQELPLKPPKWWSKERKP